MVERPNSLGTTLYIALLALWAIVHGAPISLHLAPASLCLSACMCAGFISHPSPAFQASTRLESKVIQESGHKPFSLAYFNVANPSWLSGDRGGDALLGTFPIQHHLSPPGEPIESLHGKVLEALEMSDDEFLYLSSSERVLRLLARLEKGTSTGVLSPSERELVDYFKRAIGPLPESVKFASGDSVAYFKSRSQEDSRSAFHSSLEQRQVPSFHVDGNAGADFHVNIWIATTDVAGYPLAFARSDPRMTFSGCLPVDPKWQYHFVPDMKAGEMLIFKGTWPAVSQQNCQCRHAHLSRITASRGPGGRG